MRPWTTNLRRLLFWNAEFLIVPCKIPVDLKHRLNGFGVHNISWSIHISWLGTVLLTEFFFNWFLVINFVDFTSFDIHFSNEKYLYFLVITCTVHVPDGTHLYEMSRQKPNVIFVFFLLPTSTLFFRWSWSMTWNFLFSVVVHFFIRRMKVLLNSKGTQPRSWQEMTIQWEKCVYRDNHHWR